MILRHRHTGIVVHDMSRMIEFYESIGLILKHRQVECGQFVETLLDMEGVVVETAKFAAAESSEVCLELLKFRDGYDSSVARPVFGLAEHGISHIAFQVEDLDQANSTIVSNGGTIISEPRLNNEGFCRVGFSKDPENNFLELVELA